MTLPMLAVLLGVLSAAQTPARATITGTLHDRVGAEGGYAQIEVKESTDRDLPGAAAGDRVFRVKTPQFRPAGATEGLAVAVLETTAGIFLFVDANVDGRFTESERTPYKPGESFPRAPEIHVDVTPAGGPALPFRCRLVAFDSGGEPRRLLHFTAAFRVEGFAEIAGRKTLVSLPFDTRRLTVDPRNGRIGIDRNGDGLVDLASADETIWVSDEQIIIRLGDRYVSIVSADFAARSFVLKEHAPEEYRLIEVRRGETLPDFSFTDFSGASRTLSSFKGRYVLLDFWGTWCGPCVADVPAMKTAYQRFHDRGFEILGLDYEEGGATATEVRAFLTAKNVPWPNATPESVRDLVENRFRVKAFPTLILLDRDGRVVESRTDALRGSALLATLSNIFDRP